MKAWYSQLPPSMPLLGDLVESKIDDNLSRVTLRAAAINHRDVWITMGQYPGIKEGIIMGSDGSGICDDREVIIFPSVEWGDNQHSQSQAFRVLGVPDHGTFASHIDISSSHIFPKPEHLSFIEAAAIPLAGLTAFRALFVRAQVQKGDKVLITGVGGGVALFAMQFAVAFGCQVYVTSSSQEKILRAKTLGAIEGYLYTDPNWHQSCLKDTGGIDVVIDGACGAGFNDLIKVAASGGRISFYGATRGNIDSLNARSVFWKQLSILGTTMGSPLDFTDMIRFVNEHKIKPVVDRVFSFDQLDKALAYMDAGLQFGKIVIEI